MIQFIFVVAVLVMSVAASSQPASEVTASTVPADIAALALAAAPDLTITGGDLNPGNTQFEVTGMLPNGDEVELDLMQLNEAWAVIEIQRDIPWPTVPEPARAAAAAALDSFEPVRVIESTQVADGSIVYELFRATEDGRPSRGPAMEVRWYEGTAELVP